MESVQSIRKMKLMRPTNSNVSRELVPLQATATPTNNSIHSANGRARGNTIANVDHDNIERILG